MPNEDTNAQQTTDTAINSDTAADAVVTTATAGAVGGDTTIAGSLAGITTSESMEASAVIAGAAAPGTSQSTDDPERVSDFDAASHRRWVISSAAIKIAAGIAGGPRGSDDASTIASRARNIAEALVTMEEDAEAAACRAEAAVA